MKTVFSNEHTEEIAKQDIQYCLQHAYEAFELDLTGNFFVKNPHFYLNTTDRVSKVVAPNVRAGDTVLTVAASGDYLLDSVFSGAKEIVTYDINSIQYYVTVLKVWAIQVLSYDEFNELFNNPMSMDYMGSKLIGKVIEGHDSEPAYHYWKDFMTARDIEESECLKVQNSMYFQIAMASGMVKSDEIHFHILNSIGPQMLPKKFRASRLINNLSVLDKSGISYLATEENYNKTKELIKNVELSFITSNITELKDKLNGKQFDAIFLSNIPFYLDAKTFVSSLTEQLLPLLTPKGKISWLHQGMRISWFNQKLKNNRYKVSRENLGYGKTPLYPYNETATEQVLAGHCQLKKLPLDISMEEMPTFQGSSSMVPTDVKVLVKKRR